MKWSKDLKCGIFRKPYIWAECSLKYLPTKFECLMRPPSTQKIIITVPPQCGNRNFRAKLCQTSCPHCSAIDRLIAAILVLLHSWSSPQHFHIIHYPGNLGVRPQSASFRGPNSNGSLAGVHTVQSRRATRFCYWQNAPPFSFAPSLSLRLLREVSSRKRRRCRLIHLGSFPLFARRPSAGFGFRLRLTSFVSLATRLREFLLERSKCRGTLGWKKACGRRSDERDEMPGTRKNEDVVRKCTATIFGTVGLAGPTRNIGECTR